MDKARKLALFDIDGTIAVKGSIPDTVIEGIKHIQSLGYLTTVCTGRSYRRLKDALDDAFETVISEEALIVAEHGTKLIHRDGRVVQADYFSASEVDHFVDFIKANKEMVEFCLWALPDCSSLLELWVKDPSSLDQIRAERGTYANVFHESYEELRSRLHRQEVSHFLVKLPKFIEVENLKINFTRSNMHVYFQDTYMQFVGSFSDKAKAIQFLERFHEVPASNMLVAGNAINDVDMLNLPAGKRILVGNDTNTPMVLGHLTNQEAIIRLETPEHLGAFLQEISD